MGSLERKIRRMNDKQKQKYVEDVKAEAKKVANLAVLKGMDRAYDEGFKDATERLTIKIVAVASEIVYNHWRELNKKDTRLEVFVDLMREKLEKVDVSPEFQQEVANLFEDKGNIKGVKFGNE